MGLIGLTAEALAEHFPPESIRFYPALLSSETAAMAWARSGAPHGAVVAAGYQASPRGRAGIAWDVDPDRDLVFSFVLRPGLSGHRSGWLYTTATCGLADVLGQKALIDWPDHVQAGSRQSAVGIQLESDAQKVLWAVVSVHIQSPPQPVAAQVRAVVDAVQVRMEQAEQQVLERYLSICRTIGTPVVAHMIPLGTTGPKLRGKAVGSVPDGGLVLLTERNSRVVVLPEKLGFLEKTE